MKRFVIERNIPAIGSLDRDQYGATAQRSNEALSRPDAGSVSATNVEIRPKYRLTGHKDDIYAVGFTPDGARAVTGSDDHDLRLWRVADGGEIARMPGHGDNVFSLAVAPDGTIASGDRSGEIRLWDGETGAFRKTLARQGTEVGSLSVSPDGKTLLSGAGVGAATGPSPLHVYDSASGREIVSYPHHDNVVIATAISPDGRWAATGGGNNNEIHLWDLRTGERRLSPDGQRLTLGGQGQPVWTVGFAADGRSIAWGNPHDPARGHLQHVLALPSTEDILARPRALDQAEAGSFRHAVASHGGWSLKHHKGGAYGGDAILDIARDGTTIASIVRDSTDGYDHRCYSFTPDGETIISGGMNGVLTTYDRSGTKLGDFIGHEDAVWTVAPSPDGRYLLSGSDDQTLRLWNLKTYELLLTLFQGRDGEWAMWTPQGYYDASGPGADLIGWQINHGPAKEAEYVTAAQVRKSLNRPDIVARAIQLASAEAAVKEAHGTNFKLTDLLAKPVPRLRIVSPAANASLSGGRTEVEIAFEATPDAVKLIRIQVNGRQIAEHLPAQGGGFASGAQKFTVPLAKGANTIRLTGVNEAGETPADVAVTHAGDGDLDRRGTLYILAIGVDKYPNIPGKDLRFSGADAKAFSEAMEKRVGPAHEKVVKRVLVNGASPDDVPTAANHHQRSGVLATGQGNRHGDGLRCRPRRKRWAELSLPADRHREAGWS